jgi:hypothetical protein
MSQQLACCVRFPCVHAVANTPAQRLGVLLCSLHPAVPAFPRKGRRVGLRVVLFEACSAFTRVTACTLELPPYIVTRYPKASATSLRFRLERLPGGTCTHWKAPPCHGAHPSETFVVRRNDLSRGPFQPLPKCSFLSLRCRLLSLGLDMKRREFVGVLGGAAARGARADQCKIPRIGLLWHEASAEEAVIYLGADLSCRQNATHTRDIDWLLNHPLGRPCP